MYNEEAGSAQACHPSLAGQIHITCRLWAVMGMSGSENRSERLFAEDLLTRPYLAQFLFQGVASYLPERVRVHPVVTTKTRVRVLGVFLGISCSVEYFIGRKLFRCFQIAV